MIIIYHLPKSGPFLYLVTTTIADTMPSDLKFSVDLKSQLKNNNNKVFI